MAEERKTDEALEKAVETDEDIDRYIRELTGKETPKDKEKKAEAIAAMADSLADFVIRTARDKDAPPEAVRSLPEAARIALDLLDYC